MELLLFGCFVLLASGIALYAISVPQDGRAWWWLAAATVALVLGGMLQPAGWPRTILLDFAELAAVALVWTCRTPQAAAAARLYLYSIVPAIACMLLALALAGHGGEQAAASTEKLVVLLFALGFALKLGLIPFYFWLPAVAAAAPPMTTALIVAVVDIATFAELAALRESFPWIFGNHEAVWMTLALLSMLGGALLALAQTELRRMLAFSTVTDLGFLLLGVAIGGLGLSGAWLGAMSHALSKVILFGAVGLAERRIGRTVTLNTSGLAALLPVASAAFIVAGLGFIGVPPGFGFAAYWRIYLAATQFGGPVLIAFLFLVAALDLLCYVRAIHRTWMGPAVLSVQGGPARLASAVLAVLAVLVVVLGCNPRLLSTSDPTGTMAMANHEGRTQ